MNRPIRILYVDGDPDVGGRTAAALERAVEGAVVTTATSASEGLDRLGERLESRVIDGENSETPRADSTAVDSEGSALPRTAGAAVGSGSLRPRADTGIDCVVSDGDPPDRGGIAFLEQVRERYPDLPVILYPKAGSEAAASDAISAGVTDYIEREGGTGQVAVLAERIERPRLSA